MFSLLGLVDRTTTHLKLLRVVVASEVWAWCDQLHATSSRAAMQGIIALLKSEAEFAEIWNVPVESSTLYI